MKQPAQPEYELRLRATPGNWTAPVEKRLALALKCLLRAWGLRCVSVRPVDPAVHGRTAAGTATSAPATPLTSGETYRKEGHR